MTAVNNFSMCETCHQERLECELEDLLSECSFFESEIQDRTKFRELGHDQSVEIYKVDLLLQLKRLEVLRMAVQVSYGIDFRKGK